MNRSRITLTLTAGAMLALAACGSSSTATSSTSSTTSASPTTSASSRAGSPSPALGVANTSLGRVLVDGHGMTVYLLTSDKPGKSLCNAQCLTYWPMVKAPSTLPKVTDLTARIGATRSTSGTQMLTAGGWPLYTFVKDRAPGDVSGEGVKTFGGTWYAVSPSGQPVKATAGGTAGSGGGSGY